MDAAPSDRSVLDFLYHDSRRIGSFLAQFEGDGHLQQLTRTKDGSRAKKEQSQADIKGTVGFASGTHKGSTETGVTLEEGYARVFDPYWANALEFLDVLDGRGMIRRELSSATLGQVVLVSGNLTILDLAMLKNAWGLKSVQAFARAGQAAQPSGNRQQRHNKTAQTQITEADLMLELMTVLPHSINASLFNDNQETVWASLRDEYMVTPASDLALAHGMYLPGDWSMLGILTACPDFGSIEHQTNLAAIGNDLEAGLVKSVVGQIAQTLAPIIRTISGRPSNSYAITPLLIFREIS